LLSYNISIAGLGREDIYGERAVGIICFSFFRCKFSILYAQSLGIFFSSPWAKPDHQRAFMGAATTGPGQPQAITRHGERQNIYLSMSMYHNGNYINLWVSIV